jgi:hypothetical protein
MSKKEINHYLHYLEVFIEQFKERLAKPNPQLYVVSGDILDCAQKLDKAVIKDMRSKNV